MNSWVIRFLLAVAAVALIPVVAPADTMSAASPAAMHSSTPSPNLHFIVNITPKASHAVPWTGDLTFRVNGEGIINGTYRSTSVRPDPFYGKIVTVTGALTGSNIRLDFGPKGNFPVRGTFEHGAGIVGTVHARSGGWYDFVAKHVK